MARAGNYSFDWRATVLLPPTHMTIKASWKRGVQDRHQDHQERNDDRAHHVRNLMPGLKGQLTHRYIQSFYKSKSYGLLLVGYAKPYLQMGLYVRSVDLLDQGADVR